MQPGEYKVRHIKFCIDNDDERNVTQHAANINILITHSYESRK